MSNTTGYTASRPHYSLFLSLYLTLYASLLLLFALNGLNLKRCQRFSFFFLFVFLLLLRAAAVDVQQLF